jgi:Tfp pilus assembly protein PilZ
MFSAPIGLSTYNRSFVVIAMIGGAATFEDHRRHPRISLRTELWIGQDGIFTRTNEYLRELSIGGAFIEAEQVYPIGTILSLRFKLPIAPNMISCSGVVRKIRHGHGYGVQFIDLSRDNIGSIQRQIETPERPSFSY